MNFSNGQLNTIYDRTAGRCHLCWKQLSFVNYGVYRARGAWHVEHSLAQARGGSHRAQNLFPGCIPCNLAKGTRSSRTVRAWHGRKRAPMCRARREQAQGEKIALGIVIGSLIGAAFWGARGALWLGLGGGCIGAAINPEAI